MKITAELSDFKIRMPCHQKAFFVMSIETISFLKYTHVTKPKSVKTEVGKISISIFKVRKGSKKNGKFPTEGRRGRGGVLVT